jgi:hypothetical protein
LPSGARRELGGGRRKARYLLNLFAASMDAQDPRRRKPIAAVLDDFNRRSGEPSDGHPITK